MKVTSKVKVEVGGVALWYLVVWQGHSNAAACEKTEGDGARLHDFEFQCVERPK